jgi:hypothetical protein
MKVISLAKAKDFLGATPPADASITAAIPVIDAKVKKITGNRFNYQIYGGLVSGSKMVKVWSISCNETVYNFGVGRGVSIPRSGINNYVLPDRLQDYLETGDQISGDGVPADTYIDEVYYNGYSYDDSGIPVIELSATATVDDSNAQLFLGCNIALWDIIAKGINWLINQDNTSNPSNPVSSKRVGPVTLGYGSDTEKIDGKYGMPAWFVKGVQGGRYMRGF